MRPSRRSDSGFRRLGGEFLVVLPGNLWNLFRPCDSRLQIPSEFSKDLQATRAALGGPPQALAGSVYDGVGRNLPTDPD